MIAFVLYQSRATTGFPSAVDYDILETSYHRNRADQITGYLVRTPSTYYQYLEGPRAKLEALVQDIKSDPRHDQFELLQNGVVTQRRFRNWAMGYHLVSAEELDEFYGCVHEGEAFAEIMIAYMEEMAQRRIARSPMQPTAM
jgi:hypothetical protein